MADLDLATALQMFTQGTKELAYTRALTNANDTVRQIKASTIAEEQKRSALHDVANQLTMQMASLGTPATTIQAVSNSISPKFGSPEEMNMEALLTGNHQLEELAKKQQKFKFDLEEKMLLAQAKALKDSPLGREKLEQHRQEFATKKLQDFAKSINPMVASSKTPFGQWAATEARGERIEAVLGDPSKWSNLTHEQLSVIAAGVAQMSKGGVPTDVEMRELIPLSAQIQQAKLQAKLTGKPVPLDLSGYANLYHGIVEREGMKSKEKLLDNILLGIKTSGHIAKLDPQAFAGTAAETLKQVGIMVDPNTIEYKNGKVKIPELEGIMADADRVPAQVDQVLKLANSSSDKDASARMEAQRFLASFGLSPNTSKLQATKIIRSIIKQKAFSY